MSLIFLFYLLNLQFVNVRCRLVVRPTDTVGNQGSKTVFPCGTDINGVSVTWNHISVGPNKLISRIFDSVDLRDTVKYQLNSSTTEGRYDLVIKHTEFTDSGSYICRDNDGFSDEKASAELVVVSEPECVCSSSSSNNNKSETGVSNVVEGEAIVLKCYVTYAGNTSSSISWTDSNSTAVNGSTRYNVTALQSEVHGVTTVTVLTTSVHFVASTDNILPCTCIVNINQRTAINWTSPLIQVNYPVRNIRINTTADNIYRQGEVLECLADGSRDVTYRWIEMTSRNETAGRLLVLHDVGYNLEYMCIASNFVHNASRFISTQIAVTVRRPNIKLDRLLVLIVVTIAIAAFVLVVCICVVVWRQRYRRLSEKNTEDIASDQVEQESLVEKMPLTGQINLVQVPDSQLLQGLQLLEDETGVYDELDESSESNESTTAALHCPQVLGLPVLDRDVVISGHYETLQREVTATRVPAVYTATQRPTV